MKIYYPIHNFVLSSDVIIYMVKLINLLFIFFCCYYSSVLRNLSLSQGYKDMHKRKYRFSVYSEVYNVPCNFLKRSFPGSEEDKVFKQLDFQPQSGEPCDIAHL